jgi:hypothetical protein
MFNDLYNLENSFEMKTPIYPNYFPPTITIELPNDINKQEEKCNNQLFAPLSLGENITKPSINYIAQTEIKNTKKDETKKELTTIGKKRGRQSAKSIGGHNRFSDDNLRRKVKRLVLNNTKKFINKKINIIYEGNICSTISKKELLTINQKQVVDSTVQFNKDFLGKNLGDIFSEDISEKYTMYPPEHNKAIINDLKNEKDLNKRQYFNNLFNINFLGCLEHFRGTKKIEELEGLSGFDDIKKIYENDKYYCETLIYYIMNYETITNKKIKRNKNKK